MHSGGFMQPPLLDESTPTHDKNMSVKQYNYSKVEIRKHLCNPGDPNAVIVKPGDFPMDLSHRAVGDRLKQLRDAGVGGCVMQRGYRLIAITTPDSPVKRVTYNAQAHAIIKFPDGSFESMTKPASPSDESGYIFIPSSRVHPELTDGEFLSGRWLLSTVIGGPAEIMSTLLRLRNNMCKFEQRRLCAFPEEMKARKTLVIRQFPGYLRWATASSRLPDALQIDSCIAFGMPFREMTDKELDSMLDSGKPSGSIKEAVSVRELLDPKPPWEFEEEKWLETVPTMRSFIRSVCDNHECVDETALGVMLTAFYQKLEIEYASRLSNCESRCKMEHNAQYNMDFK
jgi:hypothetical protein